VEDRNGNRKELVAKETAGTNWGLGFFKYEACDYCDDIFAETADIAVGDAWLKDYTNDSMGNSVVVVRNEQIKAILEDGIQSGALVFDTLTEDEALMSQGGGFRHRRTGLGDRLFLKQARTSWVPKKRVDAVSKGIPLLRKLIYRYRMILREKSAEVWKECRQTGNYSDFDKRMKRVTQGYALLLKVGSLVRRLRQNRT
jgi:coenzyme F420-reducing hydrogenase beta subunit